MEIKKIVFNGNEGTSADVPATVDQSNEDEVRDFAKRIAPVYGQDIEGMTSRVEGDTLYFENKVGTKGADEEITKVVFNGNEGTSADVPDNIDRTNEDEVRDFAKRIAPVYGQDIEGMTVTVEDGEMRFENKVGTKGAFDEDDDDDDDEIENDGIVRVVFNQNAGTSADVPENVDRTDEDAVREFAKRIAPVYGQDIENMSYHVEGNKMYFDNKVGTKGADEEITKVIFNGNAGTSADVPDNIDRTNEDEVRDFAKRIAPVYGQDIEGMTVTVEDGEMRFENKVGTKGRLA